MSKRFVGVMSIGLGLVAFFASSIAQADQAEWISKKDADAGAAVIVVGQELREYCAPCGDRAYTAHTGVSADVGKPSPGYWQVRVNGHGVDLAYEYVLSNGRWTNVAMAIGLNVVRVPAELPPTLPRK